MERFGVPDSALDALTFKQRLYFIHVSMLAYAKNSTEEKKRRNEARRTARKQRGGGGICPLGVQVRCDRLRPGVSPAPRPDPWLWVLMCLRRVKAGSPHQPNDFLLIKA